MSQATHLRTLNVPLAELRQYPGNAKRGNVPAILDSLRRNGQYRSVIARETEGEPLTLLAGNHTAQALELHGPGPCGIPVKTVQGEKPCGICNGKPWDPVARTEVVTCDDDTARRINLVDNRSAELGDWDRDALAELLSYLEDDYAGTGYTQTDVDLLLDYPEPQLDALLTDPDDAPALPDNPTTKPGDLWLLGPHRLLCGNANNPDDLATLTEATTPSLIYTDPPYGINAVPNDGGVSRGGRFGGNANTGEKIKARKYEKVLGDETTDTARDAFVGLTAAYPQARHIWWGGNHYAAAAALPNSSCWLVWDKENHGNDFADAELAWTNHTGAVRLLRHMWNGMLRATERGERVHPTQKPVALAEWAFSVVDPQHTRETVLDVFAGSGSTLIAAHTTGRTAFLMEMAPGYCDVICRRYQQATGTLPVLAPTGQEHDFAA